MLPCQNLILLSILYQFINSYKILIYSPRIGHSHIVFMGRIADILTEAGHNVVRIIYSKFT